MESHDRFTVIAIGFQPAEVDTIDCVLQLAGKYTLVNPGSGQATAADSVAIDLALLNRDDANAVLLWKTYLAEFPQLRTVNVGDQPTEDEPNALARRFLARPCFAKQLLNALDRASLKLVGPASVACQSSAGRFERLLNLGKLNQLAQTLLKGSAHKANPYYTY